MGPLNPFPRTSDPHTETAAAEAGAEAEAATPVKQTQTQAAAIQMSDSISFELGSASDRPPNRFQVNPVNGNSRKPQDGFVPGSVSGDREAGDDSVPHEVYRRLTNAEGELLEDDTFDATQMLNQHKPRLQRWVRMGCDGMGLG